MRRRSLYLASLFLVGACHRAAHTEGSRSDGGSHREPDSAPVPPTPVGRALQPGDASTHSEAGLDDDGESLADRLAIAGFELGETERFVSELKGMFANRDRRAICDLVQYPLSTSSTISPRRSKKIQNHTGCLESFDVVFTPRVVETVAKQHVEDLFANWRGVMFGNGELWLGMICADKSCRRKSIKIVAVNG